MAEKALQTSTGSSLSINRSLEDCAYCRAFHSSELDTVKEPWNTILYETEHFMVVPTLGAIVEGWLLIIPKRHCLCLGALSMNETVELDNVVDKCRDIISGLYTSPTLFEHGPCQINTKLGCGIDHAHLHVAPLDFSLLTASISYQSNVSWNPISGNEHNKLNSLYEQQKPYFYLKEPNAVAKYTVMDTEESQFFRKVIASYKGEPNRYDYKTNSYKENVIRTVLKCKSSFTNGG